VVPVAAAREPRLDPAGRTAATSAKSTGRG
jgi:hypothetical protein